MLVQVGVLLVAVTVACGGSQHAHRATPEESIVLVDAGAEPRQQFRYDLTAHVPERSEVSLKLRTNAAFTNTVLETGHRSVDFPTVRIVIRREVSALAPDSAAEMTSVIEDVTVLDDVVDPTVRTRVEHEAGTVEPRRLVS